MAVSANKQVYHFNSKVDDVEIRRISEDVNQFINKDTGEVKEYHSIKLICDVGEDMDRVIFKDKNMGHMQFYFKGLFGTFILRIDVEEDYGAVAKFTVIDFLVDGKTIFSDPVDKPNL